MKQCTKCLTEKALDLFYAKQSGNWCMACHKAYRDSRKQKVAELGKKWISENKEKAKLNRYLWKKNNKDLNRMYSLNRLANKKQRTPSWYGEFDAFVMKEAHHLAKLREEITGFKWDVDHIIPLCGKQVSGLHVHNNIQVIPKSMNVQKHNKYEAQ
jgi:hypothetical protein